MKAQFLALGSFLALALVACSGANEKDGTVDDSLSQGSGGSTGSGSSGSGSTGGGTVGSGGGSSGGGGMTTPCTKAECGPELGIPSRVCWDGSTAGPVCERNAKTNVCGYVITQCPPQPTCKLSDCGPEPYGVPNGTCKDGSISGPVCKPTSCGTCGWTIVSCP